ncbi:DNA recombination protein RmuC [Larsenimonas rhizosphaerae]|uniref:DNA recombination protein RmuC n=1 Tax=Larsenimonas rhizosphaerae TaxID=2944682 RepID=A0AA42CVH4_9GAMM|nr:DNA recombination protein RmuC [Larsenimonas rhizosphaerae]MCX2524976.1 DNA recombination protein RmuC [Larsenimonas rhizosphaerae]
MMLLMAGLGGTVLGALVPVWIIGRWLGAARQENELLRSRLEHSEHERIENERYLAERDILLEQTGAHLREARQADAEARRMLKDSEQVRHEQASELSVLKSRWQQAEAHHQTQIQTLEQARDALCHEFERLSARIFEERHRQFNDQSRQSLEALLQPFREQVGQFQSRLEVLHGEDRREQTRLSAQLTQLAELNHQMSEDAASLTQALKGDKKRQGNWGEMLLESVLERSGLRKDKEYRCEVSFKGEQGRRGRPDVIIDLPEGRHLIVDAKVSLVDYLTWTRAEDDVERTAALKRHLQAVRQHVETLSARDYPALEGIRSPDMVFLFMPVEPAFSLAFEHDPGLFQYAFDRQIVLVTPTTLLASLRTVANLWRLEHQNENARAITERAERLLDKFQGFVSSLDDLGEHLERAGRSHQQALKRLSDGQGSLVSQAEQLRALGVRERHQR